MDCEKLVQEKTEMQRHYVMVSLYFIKKIFIYVNIWLQKAIKKSLAFNIL